MKIHCNAHIVQLFAPDTFTITPAAPDGMHFDPATGRLSGFAGSGVTFAMQRLTNAAMGRVEVLEFVIEGRQQSNGKSASVIFRVNVVDKQLRTVVKKFHSCFYFTTLL